MAQAKTGLGGESARLLAEYMDKIERAVATLSPEQTWWRSNERSNSVGNLLLHLAGNLSQWVLAGLGGESFERHRAAEFAAREGAPPAELVASLRGVVDRCAAVARRLGDEDLAARHEIQGYRRDGFGALLHAVEHMSYHTGQIVLLAKQLGGGGIEFYPHLKDR
jgi:uncharacterized damage-inducible protein DinB